MHLLMCCGKESVWLGEPKSNTFSCNSKSESAQNKDGRKKHGASSWKKFKKWSGRHFIFWTKHTKDKASHETTIDEVKAVEENDQIRTSCGSLHSSTPIRSPEVSAAGIKTESYLSLSGINACKESTADDKNATSKTASGSSASPYNTCISSIIRSSWKNNSTSLSISASSSSDCDNLDERICLQSSASAYTTCISSIIRSSWKHNSTSLSISANSSSNCDNLDDLSITHISWIAGYEDKLCEEMVDEIMNPTYKASYILMSEEGKGEISLGDEIGSGGFGSVRKGKWTTHKNNGEVMTKDVAIKVIKQKGLEVNELKALTRLKHENVIELYFIVIYGSRTFLGVELASRGDLMTYLDKEGPLVENQARIWFGQIADAVRHCHANGIAHLDIKAENILVCDQMQVKLTDFGLSLVQPDPAKITAEQFTANVCRGTYPYMPPEVFSSNAYDSRKCDVWSLGVLLFEMLTNNYPFSVKNIKAMLKIPSEDRVGCSYLSHAKRLYKRPKFPPGLSTAVRGLITTMLKIKVKYRANMSKVKHHYWLTNNEEHWVLRMFMDWFGS